MNTVSLLGNLAADPEVKYTPKGNAITEFSLAVTERWKTEGGEEKESTFWGRCYMWGSRGEAFAKFFRKGNKVLVQGKLRTEEWEDKETKKKRSSTRIEVKEWHFITSVSKGAADQQGEPTAQPKPPARTNTPAPAAPEAEGTLPTPEEDDVPF